MKLCSWCGRENTDEATACYECGTSFAAPSTEPEETGWGEPAPARRTKRALILTAWGLALLAMLPIAVLPFMNPLIVISMPVGLWGFFTEKETKPWSLIAGWAFYAAVATVLMRAKRRPFFVCLYVVLVLALILNVAGCYKVAENIGRDFH